MEKLAEVKEYPFEFSVVMAVYNVEPFLREAVDSLIEQDFGFEHIQLIMVDDGSTDGSGAICDEYAELYPDNVIAIHKENGGVSSARNAGLPYVRGKYINFLDSDDKLALGTMRKVSDFFEKHCEETDVVAIPMRFFDGASGQHILNDKFKKGKRIVNLLTEWQTVLLSCSSSFIKSDIFNNLFFDENLKYCEDGKVILSILLEKMTLGVLNTTTYHYRKRPVGHISASQGSEQDPDYYIPYLQGFAQKLICITKEKLGYIPRFIQYSILYHLQWQIVKQKLPEDILGEKEAQEYKNILFSIISQFDQEVILAQKVLNDEHKILLLSKKNSCLPDVHWNGECACLHFQNLILNNLSRNKTSVDFIDINKTGICIEGTNVLLPGNYNQEMVQIALRVGEQLIPCQTVYGFANKYALDEVIYYGYYFKGNISYDMLQEPVKIEIVCLIDGHILLKQRLIYGKFSPVGKLYANGYFYKKGYIVAASSKRLSVKPCGMVEHLKKELIYCRELWKMNRKGARKAVLARFLYNISNFFNKKEIWLISDRIDKADDNGQAMFEYIAKLTNKKKDVYFVISSNSVDYLSMKRIGKVVSPFSWKYKILYLFADKIISSQAEESLLRPFQRFFEPYRDLSQNQKFIFLQHGITKDDVSDWLNRYNKNISMLVTATKPEYQSFLDYDYYYDENVVKLTGFPRYDRLYHNEKKQIVIMPTWRAYLVTGINPVTGARECKPGFSESEYCQMYNSLLNNERLLNAVQKYGYTFAFVNHPNMVSAAEFMMFNEQIRVIPSDYAYRDIFAESDLLITDYSSVAFDFAYLRKPVLYYQADVDEFFSGIHTYEKGYFDYERDGFGEVEYDLEKLVDRIVEYMKNNCQLKEKYRQRIDATFPFNDQNNCQRVYEAILALDEQEN